jgi:hypothetical protein
MRGERGGGGEALRRGCRVRACVEWMKHGNTVTCATNVQDSNSIQSFDACQRAHTHTHTQPTHSPPPSPIPVSIFASRQHHGIHQMYIWPRL